MRASGARPGILPWPAPRQAHRCDGIPRFHPAPECQGTVGIPFGRTVDLPDDPLSVREILRLAPRRDHPARLVVLSACESATIGDTLPDEAISLPVSLVEWGAVGVIGTLWRVADESTAILMRTFYDLWRGGGLPIPHALAAAQRALRTMTNAELLASYPALFAERAGQVSSAHRYLWESARRYNDPYYWAPFFILGC